MLKKKIEERREKAKHGADAINRLIAKCQTHGGPFSTLEDLQTGISQFTKEDDAKKVLRLELQLRRHTSSRDFKQNPELYKVNKMSARDMKFNLALMLSDGEDRTDLDEDQISFPSEEEMFQIVNATPTPSTPQDLPDPNSESSDCLNVNDAVVVVWDTKGGRKWYMALIGQQLDNDLYTVDH